MSTETKRRSHHLPATQYPEPKTEPESWHAAKTESHQGLVIDDATGNNIAVAYDKKDAPLIAAAPELLAALEAITDLPTDDFGERIIPAGFLDDARAAISKAIHHDN